MQTERGLSDFWREDKSDDRVMELASVLHGADSLIGVMGSGVMATWSVNGQSQTWWLRTKEGQPAGMHVFLDYSPLADIPPPFDGRAVDEVIGYSAHEGGHCLWSEGDARSIVENFLRSRQLSHRRGETWVHDDKNANCPCVVCEALRVANILEDAFIDFHVAEEWPVLGEYIRWSRSQIAERRPIDLKVIARDSNPDRNAMMNLWIACSLYDYPLPDRMSARVKRAMYFLMEKSVKAVETSDATRRLQLSVECWEYLAQNFTRRDTPLPRLPAPSAPIPQQSQGAGEGQDGGGGADKGGDNVPNGAEAGGSSTEEDIGSDNVPSKSGSSDDDEEDDAGEEPAAASRPEPGEEGDDDDTTPGSQSDQGGDGEGAPGNLDDFDIRELGEVPQEVIERVMDAIAHELEDLSRSVSEALSLSHHNVSARTKKGDYDRPAADKVRAQVESQIQEMRRVFDRQAQVKSRQIRGLTSGKLDRHTLARVGAGNLRVYRRREVLDTPDIAVGLLLDVSGSMGSHMPIVWATGMVFSEALIRKRGVNFMCLTYTGMFNSVQTTRICDREMGRLCIGNVDQGGGTPSGPAIASIKVLMDRMPERQKIIIHFTDGAPDDRSAVVRAVENARRAGYAVWAIGLAGMEAQLSTQYDDRNWETISCIQELPQKVAQLVKELVITR
jgi:hypothetical protein